MGAIGLGELFIVGAIGLVVIGVPAAVLIAILLSRKGTATK